MRASTSPVLLLAMLLGPAATLVAQDAQTFCNFADDNQVTIQYHPTPKEEPHNGKVWAPGITLYVQTPLTLGGSEIPLGAYSVYLIPDRKNWTAIVNKNVSAGAAYDASKDVARAPMEVGEIPQPTKEMQLSFAHMAPKECSLRVYYQKTGAFV